MTKCWGRAPGGSVVIYILNGSVWSQVGFIDLLEKSHQRKTRWLVERNRWGPQRSDFLPPGNCTKLHFGAPSTLSFFAIPHPGLALPLLSALCTLSVSAVCNFHGEPAAERGPVTLCALCILCEFRAQRSMSVCRLVRSAHRKRRRIHPFL